MLPVGDFLRRRTTPYVNWSLILINVIVFLYTLTLSTQPTEVFAFQRISPSDLFYYHWGALPACVSNYFGFGSGGVDPRLLAAVCPSGNRPALTIFTSMFMHAGWAHIIGNMLFLWIFGDNVEDHFGHLPYLIFYLAIGVIAMATQVAFSSGDLVPTVGASGAIAGVLGSYLLLYPTAIVEVVVLPLFFIPFLVPAAVLIIIWFATQLISGISSLGATAGSGIAWWAHVGGFTGGAILTLLSGGRPRAAPRSRRVRQL
ncbi:MAG TPA: rhomboid family intramembrane serine protease [Dehalococcoidia bacterium]|nr:rhomboid family intramembrane serine protease [Dehalococcoidia bacterium]